MAVDLGKQVGPLPLGAWIAVVGGGLGLAYFMNNRQSASDEVLLSESGVGTGGTPGFIDLEPPERDEPEEIEDTNAAWAFRATNWLIAQGQNPGVAANAINKYVAGQKLTQREQALVNMALAEFGALPEGQPGTPNVPSPPTKEPPKKKPPKKRPPRKRKPKPKPDPKPKPKQPQWPKRHTVRGGDTLSGIAMQFYGDGRKRKWIKIYRANRGRIEKAARDHGKRSSRGGPRNEVGWWLFPGTQLRIPRP